MSDERMPADTARKMIDEQRRDAQNKAAARINPDMDIGQEIFLKEMREAEAKGDLPPVRVYGYEDDMKVIRSMKGGETPTQALKTYDETIDARYERGGQLGQRMESIMAKVQPSVDTDRLSQTEFAGVLTLIADGKATLTDPKLQEEAVEVAAALKDLYKTETSPEGYIPSTGFSGGGKARDLIYEARPLRQAVEQARKNLIKKGEMTPED